MFPSQGFKIILGKTHQKVSLIVILQSNSIGIKYDIEKKHSFCEKKQEKKKK